MSDKKELLFSVTKDDLRIEYFRAGGNGGQNQNKVSSACRITHIESGAVGECRNYRDQPANRKAAFKRMIESEKFQLWLKMTAAAKMQGFADIEKKIDAEMHPNNLKVEVCGLEEGHKQNHRWGQEKKG